MHINCRWTEVQSREQKGATASGRGWWLVVRRWKSLELKLLLKRLLFLRSFLGLSTSKIFSSIFPLLPFKPEEQKSQYKICEELSYLEEDFWTLGKTWGWAVGGPGWDCSYETGGESHASTLQKIIFTIRLRVSLEMTKPLKSSWGTKKEKNSSGSTLRWNITFYKSNWFLQHIFNLGFYFDEQAIFSDILFTQRCLFRSIWSLSCLFSV